MQGFPINKVVFIFTTINLQDREINIGYEKISNTLLPINTEEEVWL